MRLWVFGWVSAWAEEEVRGEGIWSVDAWFIGFSSQIGVPLCEAFQEAKLIFLKEICLVENKAHF